MSLLDVLLEQVPSALVLSEVDYAVDVRVEQPAELALR